jgi:hypothetical protein
MGPTTPGKLRRFTPPAARDRDPPPVYFIEPFTPLQRVDWLAELSLANATPVVPDLVYGLLRAGATEIGLSEGAAQNAIAAIDQVEAWAKARAEWREGDVDIEPLPGEVLDAYNRFEQFMRQRHRPLGEVIKAGHRFSLLAPRIAARMGLRGWKDVTGRDGAPLAFTGDETGQPSDALLDMLQPGELGAVGYEVMRLMLPGVAEAKNSDSPSGSPDGGTSSSVQTLPAAGPSGTITIN